MTKKINVIGYRMTWNGVEKVYCANDKDVALLLSDGRVVAGCYDFHETDSNAGCVWKGIGCTYFYTEPFSGEPKVIGWQHLPEAPLSETSDDQSR